LGRPQDQRYQQQQQQQQQQNYYPNQPAYPGPQQQVQQPLSHPAVVGVAQAAPLYQNYPVPGGGNDGAIPLAIPVVNNEAMLEQPMAVPMAVAVPMQQQQYHPQQRQQQQQHPVIQNVAALGLGLLTQGVRIGTTAARITATAATAAVNAVAHEVRDHQIARNAAAPQRR
jgi:hypothetical protein